MTSLVIIDTSCANLSSVRFAFERLGVEPVVSASPAVIRAAERVVLPGVGTAAAAMRNLQQLGLVEVIQQLEQPVLGICLGMQLLTDYSAEGNVDCLGVIPARTERMIADGLPLPHMGWNTITDPSASNPLLRGVESPAYCYFVHSFAVAVDQYTSAQCTYSKAENGQPFAAMIRSKNFFGAQFHPERSGTVGAQILQNFLALTDGD